MYVSAIKVYQQLLKKEGLEQVKPGLTMSIWHNLGCAYSYLFQMEKAVECFWEAFLTESSDKELICYLLAYRSVKKPEEYEKKLKELNVSSGGEGCFEGSAGSVFPEKRDQYQTRQDGRNAGKINRGVSQEHRFMMNLCFAICFLSPALKFHS